MPSNEKPTVDLAPGRGVVAPCPGLLSRVIPLLFLLLLFQPLALAEKINVRNFGAKGDGQHDDTAAVQEAIDRAVQDGGTVYLPIGNYRITSPLVIHWTSTPKPGLPERPRINAITGEGPASVLLGTIEEPNRAVLELLGDSNTHAVNMALRDLRILMRGGSAGAFCLRVGDAKSSFLAERVLLDGANGLLLKVASSSSYAQINTVFRQCQFYANYARGWYEDETQAEVWAVRPESGGAAWDNVLFESCVFYGLVETRASLVTFHQCQFSTPPMRPITGRNFAANVYVSLGSATFRECYFEDHHTAVAVMGGIGPVHHVVIDGCHFSGITNFPGHPARSAIEVGTGRYPVASLVVRDSRFGVQHYRGQTILPGPARTLRLENLINLSNIAERVYNDG